MWMKLAACALSTASPPKQGGAELRGAPSKEETLTPAFPMARACPPGQPNRLCPGWAPAGSLCAGCFPALRLLVVFFMIQRSMSILECAQALEKMQHQISTVVKKALK